MRRVSLHKSCKSGILECKLYISMVSFSFCSNKVAVNVKALLQLLVALKLKNSICNSAEQLRSVLVAYASHLRFTDRIFTNRKLSANRRH